jgi:hypothetical protein
VIDLVLALVRGPAQDATHQLGDLDGDVDTAVEGLDRDARAAGDGVVQVAGTLVRHGVDDLGAQVVIGAGERLREVGALLDEVEDL